MKILAGVLILLWATSASSEEVSNHDVCSVRSQIAERIMELRQEGMPMREVMDSVDQNSEISDLTIVMINMAYGETAARSDRYKQLQKTEFGNAFYQNCMSEG